MGKFVLLIFILSLFIGCAQKPPTITKVDPATAPISGGTEVTIIGTGYKATPLPIVTFNGYQATYVKVINTTTLKVIAPPGVTGPSDIIVQNAKTKVKSLPCKRFSYYDEADADVTGINRTTPLEFTGSTPVGRDGAPMVLIPSGEFQMGSNDGEIDERPVHTVYLDAFYIDKYEVTNAQYKKFMDATGYKPPTYWSASNYNAPDQPVVCVKWYDAEAYCKWAGKRLPTEAEWEKAARGGLTGKKYPWGNTLIYDNANYEATDGKDIWEYTSPVGSFEPNDYGLYDIAGNVWEWCADRYGYNYYANSPESNPKGPDYGVFKILRGGSWDCHAAIRVSYRLSNDPNYPCGPTFGFRCAGLR